MEQLLYLSRVQARGVTRPEIHAIFGRAFEPELTLLPPAEVAPELTEVLVRVRALDQLVLALTG